jgi:hypothetical protein
MGRFISGVVVVGALFSGCGDDEEQNSCSLAEPTTSCRNAQVCEEVGGQPACVAPVMVQGKVIDPAGRPIAGAIVTALDANDAPASGTATSGTDGSYELRIPTPRDANGAALSRQIKLRASAAGFETFPSGLRRSLPLTISSAMSLNGKLVFKDVATDIVLTPLPSATGLGSISGTVRGEPGKRGVLVVAEGAAVLSGISDSEGAYVLFNAPAGAYTVRGYAAGVQLEPASVNVAAATKVSGVDLAVRQAPLGAVSGSVSIVNAPGGSMTSIVLVVASTFSDALKRGEVPPGLRAPKGGAPSVSGSFTVGDVPDGSYVVLAAFENDGLVRDPDTAIGGTQIQRVQIGDAARQVTLSAGFKITAGLMVMQPGANDVPEAVMGTPSFTWKDDSSEDRYALDLLDTHGNVVWSNPQIPGVSGGNVTVSYGGPPLTKGMLYQFRATSFRRGNVPISQTEDLRGVFLAQ